MDNKDQLNQIPGEANDSQDEKTSQTENQNVEATPSATAEENKKDEEQQPVAAKQSETTPEEIHEDQSQTQESVEEKEPEKTAETESGEADPDPATVKPPVADNVDEAEAVEEKPTEKPVAEQQAEEQKDEVAIEEPAEENAETAAESTPEATVEEAKEETADEASEAPVEEKAEQPDVNEEVPEKEATTEESVKPESDSEKNEVKSAAEDETVTDEDHDDEEDEDEEDHEPDEEVDYDTLSREELVNRLEGLVAADDVNVIKSKVSQIKVAYLKKTKAEKEALIDKTFTDDDDAEEKEEAQPVEDATEVKFNELFDIYKQKRAIYLENLEKEKAENLEKKKQILEDLKDLIASEETLKKTYDDFRALQERWKEIGMVPKSEVNNLWQNYHFLVEKFFDKVKINKELKDLDLKKNLEQKIELCEKAEELLLETSIIKSFKELQRLHEQWKEIGPVPADKNEDLWERFKSTTDKINQRRREHYKQLQEQHDNNYEAKVALCEKAEELLPTEVKTIRDWQNKTKQFNELFRVWKTIGPAAKKQNDEIWERFKGTLDTFFKDKKEYFGKLKEQQINNYNLKLDLCVRAEAIKDNNDWKQTTRDLINLQKEWKEIGPVPRKHSDKIWKRFRAACDEFFNRKSDHFSGIREEEKENQMKKEELIRLVEETEFGGDRNENLNKLKDFQRRWTEIGFVPFKEKDRLQNAFRSAVDKQLDKLNISSTEISIENYKSKMEVLKGSPDGNRSLGRERNFIQGKINKLRDDIHVWENNIGFLADSKKASLFKDEFEKKIDKAKKELEVLEAKLKFLNQ